MEPACKFIRGLGLPGERLSAEEVACAVWARAAGTKVAAHTRAAKLVRTRLVVEVEDATWQRQLHSLRGWILRNLQRFLGEGVVEELEFRVMPRRREPQRAQEAAPALISQDATGIYDDAAGIADPVLRRIYRANRKKATA